jgi:hypothetical protein
VSVGPANCVGRHCAELVAPASENELAGHAAHDPPLAYVLTAHVCARAPGASAARSTTARAAASRGERGAAREMAAVEPALPAPQLPPLLPPPPPPLLPVLLRDNDGTRLLRDEATALPRAFILADSDYGRQQGGAQSFAAQDRGPCPPLAVSEARKLRQRNGELGAGRQGAVKQKTLCRLCKL